MTPICSHNASTYDSIVRQTTVAKTEDHIVNFTSPAARRPEERGPENGWTKAENKL